MLDPKAKRLLVIDFSGAFVGALTYALLFEFLTNTVGFPKWLVSTQLAASCLYGIYGVALLLRVPRKPAYFRFLTNMNFAYAFFCVVAGFVCIRAGNSLGAMIVLAEAAIVGGLASYEYRCPGWNAEKLP